MSQRFDLAVLRNARSEAERDAFCRDLVAALRDTGFVRLVNHGVACHDIDRAFDMSRRFFSLALEDKLKSPHPATPNPHRGFSPVGMENISHISGYGGASSASSGPRLKDIKESYDIGSSHDALYTNIWPPAGVLDGFRPLFADFFTTCYDAELAILDALARGLGLPAASLRALHATQANELRLTHYPAVSRARLEGDSCTRIATHTDFGTVTLLFQDAVGGLEMEDPPHSGAFVPIPSGGPHECILNVGDCLGLWTGLPSTRHRVHLAADATGDEVPERWSIAYFAKPDRAALLRPLLPAAKGLEKSGEEGHFVTANEFQLMRIQATY